MQETNRQLIGIQYIHCDALRKGMGWRGEEKKSRIKERR